MSVVMYLWMTDQRCVSSTLQASTAVTEEEYFRGEMEGKEEGRIYREKKLLVQLLLICIPSASMAARHEVLF